MLPKKGIVFPNVEARKSNPLRARICVSGRCLAEFDQSAVSPCTFKAPNNQPIFDTWFEEGRIGKLRGCSLRRP
jgi:hypothetical protein